MDLSTFMSSFSFDNAYNLLEPLALFIIGITIYSIFIFKMYKFVSSRDIFGGSGKYEELKEDIKGSIEYTPGKRIVLHALEYLFLFPFIIFFFFLFFFSLVVFLSKSTDVASVMLISMAMVGAIRITSYYSEDLSSGLANYLPFVMLFGYLVETSYFSFDESLEVIKSAFMNDQMIILLVYYLIFIMLIEFFLRIMHFVYESVFKREDSTTV